MRLLRRLCSDCSGRGQMIFRIVFFLSTSQELCLGAFWGGWVFQSTWTTAQMLTSPLGTKLHLTKSKSPPCITLPRLWRLSWTGARSRGASLWVLLSFLWSLYESNFGSPVHWGGQVFEGLAFSGCFAFENLSFPPCCGISPGLGYKRGVLKWAEFWSFPVWFGVFHRKHVWWCAALISRWLRLTKWRLRAWETQTSQY